MQPAAHLVALAPSDRDVLESVAIRHAVYSGRKLNEEDLEGLPALIGALTEAIRAVGGSAFVKTAEKSAKNDVPLRPHATAQSALMELTSSEDVLRQSLSGGAAGRARYLVVQPWEHGISAHNEWRLIVCGGRVAGISQQTWRRAAGHTEASARAAVPSLIRLWQELAPLSPYADCVVDAHWFRPPSTSSWCPCAQNCVRASRSLALESVKKVLALGALSRSRKVLSAQSESP